MTQGKYVELSAAQGAELWRRWKAGESLHRIGRALDRPHTVDSLSVIASRWDCSATSSALAARAQCG